MNGIAIAASLTTAVLVHGSAGRTVTEVTSVRESIDGTRQSLAAVRRRADQRTGEAAEQTGQSVADAIELLRSLRAAAEAGRPVTAPVRGALPTGIDAVIDYESAASSEILLNSSFGPPNCNCLLSGNPLYIETGAVSWFPDGDEDSVTIELATLIGTAVLTIENGQTQQETLDQISEFADQIQIQANVVPENPARIAIESTYCPRIPVTMIWATNLYAEDPWILFPRAEGWIPQESVTSRNWGFALPGDIDCDRRFGMSDVISVLAHWGETDGPADVNASGLVNAFDIQWILDRWGPAHFPVLYVDATAPAGGDGQSWETAFRFLSDALEFERSFPGIVDQIRVAQGTYRPDQSEDAPEGTLNRFAIFRVWGRVKLTGGWAGRSAADPDERDPDRFITVLSGDLREDDLPPWIGTSDNSRSILSMVNYRGVFEGFAVRGANGGNAVGGAGLIRDVVFQHNQGQGGAATGGRMYLIDCQFIENRSARGGAVSLYGGGIIRCFFQGNTATEEGGAIHTHPLDYTEQVLVTHSLFIGNEAPIGSAVHMHGTRLINCTVIGSGGGSTLYVENNEKWPEQIDNCILYDNEGVPIEQPTPGDLLVSYCLLPIPWAGNGNIVGAPLFVNPSFGDFRLAAGSLGIDAGDTTILPTIYGPDVAGAPRIADDPEQEDTGLPYLPFGVIDMGAYERQPDGSAPARRGRGRILKSD